MPWIWLDSPPQAFRTITWRSLLYSTSSLWCMIRRALLTWNKVWRYIRKMSGSNLKTVNYFRSKIWQVPTMDSFIPILFSSSISRRSDMWLPMPILLFICASACCQDKMQGIQKNARFKSWILYSGLQRLTLISFAISGDRFKCSLIPDLAASTVETLNSLNASSTCSGVATLVLRVIQTSAMNAMKQGKLQPHKTTEHEAEYMQHVTNVIKTYI